MILHCKAFDAVVAPPAWREVCRPVCRACVVVPEDQYFLCTNLSGGLLVDFRRMESLSAVSAGPASSTRIQETPSRLKTSISYCPRRSLHPGTLKGPACLFKPGERGHRAADCCHLEGDVVRLVLQLFPNDRSAAPRPRSHCAASDPRRRGSRCSQQRMADTHRQLHLNPRASNLGSAQRVVPTSRCGQVLNVTPRYTVCLGRRNRWSCPTKPSRGRQAGGHINLKYVAYFGFEYF